MPIKLNQYYNNSKVTEYMYECKLEIINVKVWAQLFQQGRRAVKLKPPEEKFVI